MAVSSPSRPCKVPVLSLHLDLDGDLHWALHWALHWGREGSPTERVDECVVRRRLPSFSLLIQFCSVPKFVVESSLVVDPASMGIQVQRVSVSHRRPRSRFVAQPGVRAAAACSAEAERRAGPKSTKPTAILHLPSKQNHPFASERCRMGVPNGDCTSTSRLAIEGGSVKPASLTRSTVRT